jgi:hypothetical protein
MANALVVQKDRLPSVSAYLVHFGTLRNIYRLIGYTANQNYWDELAAHKRWVDLLLENAERLRKPLRRRASTPLLMLRLNVCG